MSEPAPPAKPEPEEFRRFRAAMQHLVTVPKTEILRREEEYRERRKQIRNKKTK